MIGERRSQEGFILLAVLGLLALSAGLIYSRLGEQGFLIRQISYVERVQQARAAALSAVGPAKLVLAVDAQMGGVDTLQDRWAIPFPAEVPDATVWVQIVDSARRWNVNGLMAKPETVDAALLGVYQNALLNAGIDDGVLGELVDWLDPDSDYSLVGRGREAPDYAADGLPYGPRNGPMMSPEELYLLPLWSADVEEVLRPMLSVAPECLDGQLNLNTASREALMGLDGFFSQADIDTLLTEREQEPFESVSSVYERIGFEVTDEKKETAKLLAVASNCFEVQIVAESAGVSSELRVNMTRSKSDKGQPQIKVVYSQWKR